MIYIYGDSHARESFKGLAIPHQLREQNSVTMHRIGRDKRIVNWIPPSKEDTIVISYGEVDCRAHIGKQIEKGRLEDEIINELTSNYFDTLLQVCNTARFIIVAIIPPKSGIEYCEEYPDSEFPFVGTDEERVRYTKKVNQKLEEYSNKNNMIFFNPYLPYTNADGCLRRELSDRNVHIGNSLQVIEQFMNLL